MASPAAPTGTAPELTPMQTRLKQWLTFKFLTFQTDNNYECSVSVEDFLNTTKTNSKYGRSSWLADDIFSACFAILASNMARHNDCVLEVVQLQQLYNIGVGASSTEAYIQDVANNGLTLARMRSSRFIIAPISDGLISAQSVMNRFNTERPERRYNGLDFQGLHWGLLVVDREKNCARFFDGNLTLIKDEGKIRIKSMFNAGRAAGKVLCGIEKLLTGNKTKFDVKTVKWAPDERNDNDFLGDEGAGCGPWVFAMLEYLYNHTDYLENVQTSFDRRDLRKHRRQLDFNSFTKREQLRDMIIRKAEEINPQQLLTLDIVRTLVHPVEDAVDVIKDSTAAENDGSGHRPPFQRDGKKDSDPDSDDGDDDNSNDYKGSGFAKTVLTALIRSEPNKYKDMSKTARYTAAADDLRGAKSFQQAHDDGSRPPSATLRSILVSPTSVVQTPADFMDEANLPQARLDAWVRANDANIRRIGLGHKATHFSHRAVLQLLSGRQFARESEHRLRTLFIQDEHVFNADERQAGSALPHAEIAQRLAEAYETRLNMEPLKRTRSTDSEETGSEPRTKRRRVIDLTAEDRADPSDWLTKQKKKESTVNIEYDRSKIAEEFPQDSTAASAGDVVSESTKRIQLYLHFGGRLTELTSQSLSRVAIRDSRVFDRDTHYRIKEGGQIHCQIKSDQIRRMLIAHYGDDDSRRPRSPTPQDDPVPPEADGDAAGNGDSGGS